MLEIPKDLHPRLLECFKTALDHGTLAEFTKVLEYLNNYGSEPGDLHNALGYEHTQATLFHDFAPLSFGVHMARYDDSKSADGVGDYKTMWVGGLIYDPSDHKWSVHT